MFWIVDMVLDDITSRVLDIWDDRYAMPREGVEYRWLPDIGTTDDGDASEHRQYGKKYSGRIPKKSKKANRESDTLKLYKNPIPEKSGMGNIE
jgi:hypothetical protein